MTSKLVHVAVGVIENARGEIFIARRAAHQHQGGLWEFPGGKVEAGESVISALGRELHEEINIIPTQVFPLVKIRHDYADKSVLLDVYHVKEFSGEPFGREEQEVRWVAKRDLHTFSFPKANRHILSRVCMPRIGIISGEYTSESDFILRARRSLEGLNSRAILFVRPPVVEKKICVSALKELKSLCALQHSHLILNSRFYLLDDVFESGADGYHLTSSDLNQYTPRDELSHNIYVGASCHTNDDLVVAQHSVDYAFLSPVQPTRSHPEVDALGWNAYSQLCAAYSLPVYALGGMEPFDQKNALNNGGVGVVGIGSFWL